MERTFKGRLRKIISIMLVIMMVVPFSLFDFGTTSSAAGNAVWYKSGDNIKNADEGTGTANYYSLYTNVDSTFNTTWNIYHNSPVSNGTGKYLTGANGSTDNAGHITIYDPSAFGTGWSLANYTSGLTNIGATIKPGNSAVNFTMDNVGSDCFISIAFASIAIGSAPTWSESYPLITEGGYYSAMKTTRSGISVAIRTGNVSGSSMGIKSIYITTYAGSKPTWEFCYASPSITLNATTPNTIGFNSNGELVINGTALTDAARVSYYFSNFDGVNMLCSALSGASSTASFFGFETPETVNGGVPIGRTPAYIGFIPGASYAVWGLKAGTIAAYNTNDWGSVYYGTCSGWNNYDGTTQASAPYTGGNVTVNNNKALKMNSLSYATLTPKTKTKDFMTNDYYLSFGISTPGAARNNTYTLNSVTSSGTVIPAVNFGQSFSITYDLGGGTNPSNAPTTAVYGQTVNLPTPTHSDKVFKSWSYHYNDVVSSGLDGTITTGSYTHNHVANITLKANWENHVHNATWVSNGDGTHSGYCSGCNKTVTQNCTASSNWTDKTNYQAQTCTACGGEVNRSIKITYSANGASNTPGVSYSDPTPVESGMSFSGIASSTVPSTLTYNGEQYSFQGWSTSQPASIGTGTATIQADGRYSGLTQNTTLYAVWKKENKVVFWFNGGAFNSTPSFHQLEESFTLPANAQHDEYKVTYFSDRIEITDFTADTTLIAHPLVNLSGEEEYVTRNGFTSVAGWSANPTNAKKGIFENKYSTSGEAANAPKVNTFPEGRTDLYASWSTVLQIFPNGGTIENAGPLDCFYKAIYESDSSGNDYGESNKFTLGTLSAYGITAPENADQFLGYYNAANGGTQYTDINPRNNSTGSTLAPGTNFVLYPQWSLRGETISISSGLSDFTNGVISHKFITSGETLALECGTGPHGSAANVSQRDSVALAIFNTYRNDNNTNGIGRKNSYKNNRNLPYANSLWFIGWNTKIDGSGDWITELNDTTIAMLSAGNDGNKTVYAVWGFPVIWNAHGGTFSENYGGGSTVWTWTFPGYADNPETDGFTYGGTYYNYRRSFVDSGYSGYPTVNDITRDNYVLFNNGVGLLHLVGRNPDGDFRYGTLVTGEGENNIMTYTGWTAYDTAWAKTPEGIIQFYAIWLPKITFNPNGGSNVSSMPEYQTPEIEYGSASGSTEADVFGTTGGSNTFYQNFKEYKAPECTYTAPDGKVFAGWKIGSDGTTIYQPGDTIFAAGLESVTHARPITLYATWKDASYSITYETNGGTINSGKVTTYNVGTGATLPTDVTKTGYTFDGWYSNSGLTGSPVTAIGTSETGNKTFYAKWIPDTFTIAFDAGDGTNAPSSINVSYGNNINFAGKTPTPPSRHTFTNWSVPGSSSTVTTSSNLASGNAIYNELFNYAKNHGGTVTLTANYTEDAYYTLEIITPSGATYDPTKVSSFKVYKSDIQNSNTYTVSNTAYLRNLFDYDETVTQTGYVIDRWILTYGTGHINFSYYGKNNYTEFEPGDHFDTGLANTLGDSQGKIYFEPHFIPVTYTATFNVDTTDSYGTVAPGSVSGVTIGSSATINGATITVNGTPVTATPTAADAQYTYTFDHWSVGGTTVSGSSYQINGATTFTAHFTRTEKQFIVTFMSEDGSEQLGQATVNYGGPAPYTGTTPTKPATAQYTYTFIGWTVEPNGAGTNPNLNSVTADITVYAQFRADVRKYTVTVTTNNPAWGNVNINNIGVTDYSGGVTTYEVENVPYGYYLKKGGDTLNILETAASATAFRKVKRFINTAGTDQYEYDFVGWYIDGNLITDTPTIQVTGDVTVVATFEEIPKEYDITYVLNYTVTEGYFADKSAVVKADWYNITSPMPTYTYNDKTAIALPGSISLSCKTAEFLGWYDNADYDGEPVTAIPAGSTGEKTFYAKWAPYTVFVRGNGFKLKVGNDNWENSENNKLNKVVNKPGTEITLQYTGTEEFCCWTNGTGKFLGSSTELSYTFYSVSYISAVTNSKDDNNTGYKYVAFMSDERQVYKSGYYSSYGFKANDIPTGNEIPTKAGWSFAGWTLSTDENATVYTADDDVVTAINDAIENDNGTISGNEKVIMVFPVYTKNTNTYGVVIIDGNQTINKTLNFGEALGFKCQTDTFTYWTEKIGNGDETIVSFNPYYNIRKFTDNTYTYTAHYDDPEIGPITILTVPEVYVTDADEGKKKYSFTTSIAVPEGETLNEMGIIYSGKSASGTLNTLKLDMPNVSKYKSESPVVKKLNDTFDKSGTITLNLLTASEKGTFYVRGYAITSEGTVYSDIITYNILTHESTIIKQGD